MVPAELIARTHAVSKPDSLVATAIPNLQIVRSDSPTFPSPAVYRPSLCVVIQGEKEATLGDRSFSFGGGEFLVVPVELPVSARVVKAPFLCLVLTLEPDRIYDILRELEPARLNPGIAEPPHPMPLPPAMSDAFLRLLRCLDQPRDVAFLSPLIEKEILYHLLHSDQGGLVRPLGLPTSQTRRVAKAIEYLRAHFHEPIAMDDLAHRVNLSPSAFFLHFKRVTSMSPLRYQKELRLHEARRLLVTEGADAASAAYQVGYESPSQFSKDYARMFGLPPGADRKRLAAV